MSITHQHTKIWYRTNPLNNAYNDLQKLNEFYDRAQQDESYWKWVILALHSALYNFMLISLMHTDMSGIWVKDIRDIHERIDIFNKKMRLITFSEAFKRIRDANKMRKYVTSKPFVSSRDTVVSMVLLNKQYRNQFIHYAPVGWSITVAAIKEVIRDTLPVLSFLISESGNIILSEDEKKKLTGQVNSMLAIVA